MSQVGNVSYWGNIVTYAIRTGFSGALSTVSTFVAEVMTFPSILVARQKRQNPQIGEDTMQCRFNPVCAELPRDSRP